MSRSFRGRRQISQVGRGGSFSGRVQGRGSYSGRFGYGAGRGGRGRGGRFGRGGRGRGYSGRGGGQSQNNMVNGVDISNFDRYFTDDELRKLPQSLKSIILDQHRDRKRKNEHPNTDERAIAAASLQQNEEEITQTIATSRSGNGRAFGVGSKTSTKKGRTSE
jgi:hypothetical protein